MRNSIEVRDLKKSFKEVSVLDGVSFAAEKGKIMALLGPNGAGKTTLVRILSTLIDYDYGKASVNGFDVTSQPDMVRASIGLTGQYAAVDEYLTGFENLEMIGRLYHIGAEETRKRASDLLERFDLFDEKDRIVRTYSGGMRRKIDLAMSLIASPPVLFLDEPTTGLDPRSRFTMWDTIKDLTDLNVTILLTTQYMEEADFLSDKILVLDRGKIIAEGTSEELKARSGSNRIEFSLKNQEDIDKINDLFIEEKPYIDKKKRSVSLATEEGVGHLKNILDKLERTGIGIDNLSYRQPTLDDVFLSLTGHMTGKEEENNS